MNKSDAPLYKYGLPINEYQRKETAVCDLYRKLFLTATFPIDFVDEVSLQVYQNNVIDPDVLNHLNDVYDHNSTLVERALEYLKEWLSRKNGKLTLVEIYEYQSFHRLEDEKIEIIVSDIINEHYNTPTKIKDYLDTFIVGQEDAKRILCVGFYIHLVRIGKIKSTSELSQDTLLENFPKPNILVSGSTGSGKTYIISSLCEFFRIPFLKIDCSSLVSSGYVGTNLNTYLKILIDKNGLEKSKEAILYFDEFDKISEKNTGNSGSVGGVELQQEFLTLLEDKHVQVRKERLSDECHFLNARNLMLIFSGSFAGIESIIERRLQHKENVVKIGYTKKTLPTEGNLLKKLNFDDLIQFGIIPELVGRIGFIAVLDKLTVVELISILKQAKFSVMEQYRNYFRFNNDKLIVEDEVYELIAEEALRRNIGARALQGVIFQLLSDLLFESVNHYQETFVISKEFFKQRIG